MTMLDEKVLARALHDSVPEPPPAADRAERVRRAAGRVRLRRRVGVAGCTVAVALAIGVPVGLVGSGPSYRNPPVAGGPTSGPPAPPTQNVYCASARCDPARVLAAIRHPLHLPTVPPGSACPTSPVRRFPTGAGFSGSFWAIGKGPLYLAGPVLAHSSSVGILPGKRGWGWEKVIWVVSAEYPGPLLLRGGRVDGSGELRFDHYLNASGASGYGSDMRGFRQLLYVRDGLHATAQYVLESYPSGIHLKAPGCYAIQVDGQGFSEVLVFRATG